MRVREPQFMGQSVVQVDAFTSRPFAGNPAAVCVLEGPADADWMQAVAREMNLSETSFLYKTSEGYQLRWFTPSVEVDLCGHATLAAAHVLWDEGYLAHDLPAVFQSRSGVLTAEKRGDWIELDFPSEPPEPVELPEALARAMRVPITYSGRNRFDWLVEVESEAAVRALDPDIGLLATVPARGIIVTSAAETAGYDFVSRFFAPCLGVPEDPVCGSAHCCLGPYWEKKLGRDMLVGYQASARGGVVRVRRRGNRIVLGGQAVTVLRGELAGYGPGAVRNAAAR